MGDDDLQIIKDRMRELALSLKRQQNYGDLQDERAGRETGKARRFTREGEDPAGAAARDSDADLLWTMTIDLYMRAETLRERLPALERATEEALRRSAIRLRQEEEHLQRLRENSARDAKGERVYRTADGKDIYYEDGRRLAPEEEAGVRTRPGAPTWETYREQRERYERAHERHREIEEYQRRVVKTRETLESGAPLDEETLTALEKDLKDLPDDVAVEMNATASRLSAAGPAAHSTASLQSGFEAAVLARNRPDDPEQTRPGAPPGAPCSLQPQQLIRPHTQPARQTPDRIEPRIAHAALHARHVGPVHVRALGELFHGEALRRPQSAHARPEGGPEIVRHRHRC
jgi:hypothetical protein